MKYDRCLHKHYRKIAQWIVNINIRAFKYSSLFGLTFDFLWLPKNKKHEWGEILYLSRVPYLIGPLDSIILMISYSCTRTPAYYNGHNHEV